jgi:hypothetical protein
VNHTIERIIMIALGGTSRRVNHTIERIIMIALGGTSGRVNHTIERIIMIALGGTSGRVETVLHVSRRSGNRTTRNPARANRSTKCRAAAVAMKHSVGRVICLPEDRNAASSTASSSASETGSGQGSNMRNHTWMLWTKQEHNSLLQAATEAGVSLCLAPPRSPAEPARDTRRLTESHVRRRPSAGCRGRLDSLTLPPLDCGL